jgi:type II secretory pathway pseudopilin PulG
MAALLVSLAVMSVLMTAALPTWRHAAQREKEAELVFRGEQYARAVALYRTKNGNAFPPSVDVLVDGKYLRKKYLDPITKAEFEVIGATAQVAGRGAPPPMGRGQTPAPAGRGAVAGATPGGAFQSAFGTPVSGGIMGVRSKSKEDSIRIYKGQTRYDQWAFVFTAANRPGGAAGAINPGMPGGRGGQTAPGPATAPGGRGPGGQRGFQLPPFGGRGRGQVPD